MTSFTSKFHKTRIYDGQPIRTRGHRRWTERLLQAPISDKWGLFWTLKSCKATLVEYIVVYIYTGRVLILQCRAELIRLFVSFLYHCALLWKFLLENGAFYWIDANIHAITVDEAQTEHVQFQPAWGWIFGMTAFIHHVTMNIWNLSKINRSVFIFFCLNISIFKMILWVDRDFFPLQVKLLPSSFGRPVRSPCSE